MDPGIRSQRIKKIYAGIEEEAEGEDGDKEEWAGDVEVIIFLNATEPHVDRGFFYITGATEGVFEGAVAAIYPDGNGLLVVSMLEEETAKKTGMPLHIYKDREEWKERVREALGNPGVIGIHGEELTYSSYLKIKDLYPEARIVDVTEAVSHARAVKDSGEIERIKEACRIASRAAETVVEAVAEGVREHELAAELSYQMQKMGASGNSFDPISAFGPNSAEPHYLAGDRAAKKGDAILLDFGCNYKRYASDITRTMFLGKADREQREVYETVLHAQQIGIDAVEPGANGADVDRKVRDYIDSTPYKGKFIHSTGHSIGLSVHDGFAINHKIDLPLREGMVFTVEPGIYLPGRFGVRIEDDILVTSNGAEVLTTAPKDLLEIL
ncbi:MAG: aminopeptidase P family protein [Thermoplasmata archaeon]|nr:aminopeptidase P family protein [Thermoplasmata archaeon]